MSQIQKENMAIVGVIEKISPIDGADRIVRADVFLGASGGRWSGVVPKNDIYAEGKQIVAFLPDAIVPQTEPFSFMSNRHWRVTPMRLRGCPSEILIMDTYSLGVNASIGTDVTTLLSVLKFEKDVPMSAAGDIAGNFPLFIPKTDEPCFQIVPEMVEMLRGKECYVSVKVDGCLPFGTYLDIWGGGSIRIGDLVLNKKDVTLVGMNDKGEYVPTKIENYFRNGVKDNWVKVFVINRPKNNNTGRRAYAVHVTSNHLFLTNNNGTHKYIEANKLQSGDIVCSPSKAPSKSVKHVIMSSLLGDGNLNSNGSTYSFSECHTSMKAEYIDEIERWLGTCVASRNNYISGYGKPTIRLQSKHYQWLNEISKHWYDTNRKHMIPDDLSWIDNFSIAKWYMDDGSLRHSAKQKDRARFHTNRYKKEDVDRLALKLQSMFNIVANVRYSKGWEIELSADKKNNIDNFWKSISPFIVGCMRYKLPEEYRNGNIVSYPDGYETIDNYDVVVDHVEPIYNIKKNFPSGRIGFDVTTETGNYVACGLVVHNSSCTVFNYQGRFGVCSRNWELKDSPSAYWNVARKYKLDEVLPEGFAIQGEVYGSGIQSNPVGISGIDLSLFNAYSIEGHCYFGYNDLVTIAKTLGVPMVPIESVGIFNPASGDEIRKMAEGKYPNGKQREGIVIRPIHETIMSDGKRLSFKILSLMYKGE